EGAIYSPRGSGEEFRATQFETMRYVLDYAPAKKVTLSRQTSMSLKSLWAELTPLEPSYQRRVLEIELYKRITLPWACLAMALASIPMAVMDPRSGRGAGYLRAVFLVGGYFIVWAAFKDLAASRRADIWVLWLPSLLIMLYGMLRLWQLNTDQESLWRVFALPRFSRANRQP
ncbi:MAG: LptF/LptG family permease, partial [Deltaproteobacteria bacterium]|nr:LptF/LptG family permease [Deltaproteobacteria bacterium]